MPGSQMPDSSNGFSVAVVDRFVVDEPVDRLLRASSRRGARSLRASRRSRRARSDARRGRRSSRRRRSATDRRPTRRVPAPRKRSRASAPALQRAVMMKTANRRARERTRIIDTPLLSGNFSRRLYAWTDYMRPRRHLSQLLSLASMSGRRGRVSSSSAKTGASPPRQTREHAPFARRRKAWAEQDPEDWWRASREAIRAALTDSGVAPSSIRAVGLSGQMHGAVLAG